MCRNDKKFATKIQRNRRSRRGKGGTKAIARQALASVIVPDSDVLTPFKPPPLLSAKSQIRVAVARRRIKKVHYDHPEVANVLLSKTRLFNDVRPPAF